MAARFIVIPQWQGSGSSRAMRLVDGAEAIRGDLPAASVTVVDVPTQAGDEQGTGLKRFGSLALVRERTAEALESLTDVAIAIGGDCSIELAPIEHAIERSGGDLAVVWFDAHPDLHTTASSETGAFTGMVLRTLLGDGVEGLAPAVPLDASRVVLAGTRSIDEAEDELIAERGIRTVGVTELESTEELVAAVEATGAASVYIHIDVDVLDPGEFSGKSDPVPFGLAPAQLVTAIKALRARFELVGAGITEFAPASPEAAVDDLGTILRIVGALTAKPTS